MTADNSAPGFREPATEPTHGATRSHETGTTEYVEHESVVAPAASRRQDLVSWGAVWAGLVVTLALFLLLELVFFSLGWLDLGQGAQDNTAGIISAVLALVAFFVGGITAGATSVWRDGKGGLFHGIALWALGVVAILFLTLFGGGALFGSVASVVAQTAQIQQAVNVPDVQLEEAVSTARSGAGVAVLALLLPLVAAAIGGSIGGKMGSRAPDATSTPGASV